METLRHLATLHLESQPSGRLRSIKWYVNSIATKDFLLPAMLIILDLHFDNQAERSGDRQNSQSLFFWTPEQRMEMISNLEVTREIWKGLSDGSVEAVKASNILELMLDKLKSPKPDASASPSSVPVRTDLFEKSPSIEMQPEHSAAMTLGMLSGGMTPNTAASLNTVQSPGGTIQSALDLNGMGSSTSSGMTPDFSADMFGMNNVGSPFSSMFNGMAPTNNNLDFTSNFDWVRLYFFRQAADDRNP